MDQILKLNDIPEIELIPFCLRRDDDDLKKNYLKWLSDESVTRLIGSEQLIKENVTKQFIEDSFVRFTSKTCIGFFIFHKIDNVFIGTTKLDKISNFTKSAEDGILIGEKEYWGKGISKLVYTMILLFGFTKMNLEKINGGCNEKNISMIKTFKSMGYKLEGIMRKSDNIDGNLSDHLHFGILKDEFLSKTNVRFS